MGLNPLEAPVDVTIACWEWGAYLGEEGKRDGIRAKVSSWRRISPDSLIPHAKASGQYLNSVLAKVESLKAGYEEAILLDDHGHVCEGTGENIYIVRDGEIVTPGQHNSILDGITRRSIIQIARDLGYTVVERNVARAELYLADEVFMSGTAAELVPVREIDDHAIGTGEPGRDHARAAGAPSTTRSTGARERYREWLDVVRPRDLETPRASRRASELPGRPASGERRGRSQPDRRPPRAERSPDEPRPTASSYTTRPCATAWAAAGMSLTAAGEAARRARARRARRAPDRGRLPGVEPEGAGAVRAARGRAAASARRSSPSG